MYALDHFTMYRGVSGCIAARFSNRILMIMSSEKDKLQRPLKLIFLGFMKFLLVEYVSSALFNMLQIVKIICTQK